MQDNDGIRQTKQVKGAECSCATDGTVNKTCKVHGPDASSTHAPDADKERSLAPKQATAAAPFGVRWMAASQADLVDQPNPLTRAFPSARTIRLRGTFIDTTMNLNGWSVPAEELANIARQLSAGGPVQIAGLAPVQMRLDHGDGVRDVVGQYTSGVLVDVEGQSIPADAPRERLAQAVRVDFEGVITLSDPNVAIPILRGYVRGVSPNLIAKAVECSLCGKSAWPSWTCDHNQTAEAGLLLRDTRVKEGSIVATPAYEDRTPIVPVGFAAALAEATKPGPKETTSMADPPNKPAGEAAAGASASEVLFMAMKQNQELAAELRALKEQRASEQSAAAAAKKAAEDKEKEDKEKEDKEKEEKDKTASSARARVAEAEAGVSDKERIEALRASRATATPQTTARAVREWGAMAGPIDQHVTLAVEQQALQEIVFAARRDPKFPFGRFGIKVADGGGN